MIVYVESWRQGGRQYLDLSDMLQYDFTYSYIIRFVCQCVSAMGQLNLQASTRVLGTSKMKGVHCVFYNGHTRVHMYLLYVLESNHAELLYYMLMIKQVTSTTLVVFCLAHPAKFLVSR